MIEHRLLIAPFDEAFVLELWQLVEHVFGARPVSDAVPLQSAGTTQLHEELRWKLARMPDVSIHAGYDGAKLIAFKIGYAATPVRYYSWLGGVHEAYRRQGLARRLLEAQHEWAKLQGYTAVETGAVATNAAMLCLNLTSGFRVIGTYYRSDLPRVLLLKELERITVQP